MTPTLRLVRIALVAIVAGLTNVCWSVWLMAEKNLTTRRSDDKDDRVARSKVESLSFGFDERLPCFGNVAILYLS